MPRGSGPDGKKIERRLPGHCLTAIASLFDSIISFDLRESPGGTRLFGRSPPGIAAGIFLLPGKPFNKFHNLPVIILQDFPLPRVLKLHMR